MLRQLLRRNHAPNGLAECLPAGLAILLGMMTLALSAMMSFGYLMLRSPGGSDVDGLPAYEVAGRIVELPGEVELWRGIPRHATESERDTATQRETGRYEPTPIQPGVGDVQWLRAYCTQESRFRRKDPNVYKLCGWFHADWAVVFSRFGQTAEFAFCFGCDEVLILVDGHEPLFLDLARSESLRTYFEQYRDR